MAQRIIDLSTLTPTQGFVIQGDAPDDLTGRSVSTAGDVNGDGFADVIVGAPFISALGPDAGTAYLVFGGDDRFGTTSGGRQVIDLTTLTAAQGFVIHGDAGGDSAGYSVSAAGDVNGDGFADVIVGARYGDDGGHDAGEAYVVFGHAEGFGEAVGGRQVIDLTTLTAAQGFVIQGDTAFDQAGRSVSAAGDVNGDGIDDVIVGAPRNADGGGGQAGAAYVLFGSVHSFGTTIGDRQVVDLTKLSATRGFIIQGDAGNYAGLSVSDAGDVNGDSFDDLIVGAPGLAGAAYVVFGGADGFGTTIGGRQVVDVTTLSGAQGFVIQDDWRDGGAGFSVSGAGDVNGDGFDDLIVGAPVHGQDNGEAYVVFGGADGFGTTIGGRQVVDLGAFTASQGFVIRGGTSAWAGWSVSAAGDVNGDGFADVIVGAPHNDDGGHFTGAAYVVFGGTNGFGTTIDGRQVVDTSTIDSAHGLVVQGAADIDVAGWSVSAAGDVDGDGFDDLIVGSPINDDGGISAGAAHVVYGGDSTDAVYRVGGEGDDVVRTGPVGRTVFGAQGDDTVLGNVGADSLNGGSGDDSLNGGANDDTIAGGSGDDRVIGNRGHDQVMGGDGNDTLSGWAGNDTLSGWAGNDTLSGEANQDSLVGNAGDDSLDGGQGHDTLYGDDGADALVGGGRGDVLVGGAGADLLTGGSGWDRFVFAAGSSSPAAPDTITDFQGGLDDFVVRTGGAQGTFLGEGAFTGGGGIEVRWDANLHQIQVDLNGDGLLGANDIVVAGTTLATLTAQDLVFV